MSFWDIVTVLIIAGQSFLLLVSLLLYIAYALYADRKIWAAVQMRRGPNVVGPWGLLQSFADLLKFVLKEPVIPSSANKGLFLLAPLVTATLAFASWAVIPLAEGWVVSDINVGVLYIFAISSLGVYGIIIGGWASNSKYPFLAALRSAAQMVSYEVSIGFVIITVLMCAGSLNLTDIVRSQDTRIGLLGWYWLWLFPMFVIFFISAMAETNRPPFDLPEAESELVAGYMTEYSGLRFLLFFIGEFATTGAFCAIAATLFLGGWALPTAWVPFDNGWMNLFGPFILFSKVMLVAFLIFWFRFTYPRFREDQLQQVAWKVLIPLALANIMVTAVLKVAF
jgi:NADH-quinone oxidoreductase subunit H